MCGILGIVSLDERPVSVDDVQLAALRDMQSHRGPDDAGLKRISPRAVFAHRRLSIRDPGHGQQPCSTADGRWTVTYNGELYNADELKAITAARFGQPETNCDTELLLKTTAIHWEKTPAHLRGMFAFAAYDRDEERLLLARDRFGVKPLYYSLCGYELLFASSPVPLREHRGYNLRVNSRALIHYLITLRLHLGTETLYEGIHSLPPGHLLQLDRDGIRLERYWNYPTTCELTSYAAGVESLQKQMAEATACRLVSDVPVGMMLSGGVDSCLLGSYVREGLGPNFRAECGAGQETGVTSEAQLAAATADWLGCQFESVQTEADAYQQAWPLLIERSGLPLATPSDVIIYRLAASLKQKVGVVLGGEGADELFGGYSLIHGLGWQQDRHDSGAAVESLILRYFQQASLIPLQGLRMLLPDERVDEHVEAILAEYLILAHRSVLPEQPAMSAVKGILHRLNLESLLLRLDTATMAASLEARVPFTDHRLVESFWAIPSDWMIRSSAADTSGSLAVMEQAGQLESKRLLRSVAAQRIPQEIAQRRKQSFPTAVPAWLTGEWRRETQSRLTSSRFLNNRCNPAVLQQLAASPEQAGMWLWPLWNLAIWSEQLGLE